MVSPILLLIAQLGSKHRECTPEPAQCDMPKFSYIKGYFCGGRMIEKNTSMKDCGRLTMECATAYEEALKNLWVLCL